MFDDYDYIARVEFENDELLFRKGNYNPFFIANKRTKEKKELNITAEDEQFASLFGFKN